MKIIALRKKQEAGMRTADGTAWCIVDAFILDLGKEGMMSSSQDSRLYPIQTSFT